MRVSSEKVQVHSVRTLAIATKTERLDVINGNDAKSARRTPADAKASHTPAPKPDLPRTAFSSKLLAKTDMTSSYQRSTSTTTSTTFYAGNAFDNPHRNGGTLPRQKRGVTSSTSDEERSASFLQPKDADDVTLPERASEVMRLATTDNGNAPDLISGLLSESLRTSSCSSAKDADDVTSPTTVDHIMETVASHELAMMRSDANERLTSAQQRRLTEQEINRSWDEMVTTADLVNGHHSNLMDLIKFVDQDDSDRSSGDVSKRASTVDRKTTSGARRGSATDSREPLSFTNPVFGQVFDAGSLRKQRHFPVPLSDSNTEPNTHAAKRRTHSHSSDVSSSQQLALAAQSSHSIASAHRDHPASFTSSLTVTPSKPQSSRATTEHYDNHDAASDGTHAQTCRQTEPPPDLQLEWSRSKSIHESPDTRWTDLNTPQSRAPLATSLPSQVLFLSPTSTSSITPPMSHPPKTSDARSRGTMTSSQSDNTIQTSSSVSKSFRSAADDYVYLEYPSLPPMTSSTHVPSVRMGVSSVQRRATPTDSDKQRLEVVSAAEQFVYMLQTPT